MAEAKRKINESDETYSELKRQADERREIGAFEEALKYYSDAIELKKKGENSDDDLLRLCLDKANCYLYLKQ